MDHNFSTYDGFACLGGWSSLCPNERDYDKDYILSFLLLWTNYTQKNDVEAKQKKNYPYRISRNWGHWVDTCAMHCYLYSF